MYYKSVCYAVIMVVFGILGYVFLESGFNTKTKVNVDYQDSSEVFYKVNYLEDGYIADNDKYVSNMVNYIDFNYNYNNLLSEYVSGYYKYNVEAYLITYEDNITDSLWKRKSYLVNENTVVLDKNNINNIKIEDSFRVDFKEYKNEINKFINDYQINVSGYLHIRINIFEFFNFVNLNNEYADSKVITVDIPLTEDIFKIKINNIDNKNSYYDFSSRETMNIVFLIIGTFCLSASISLCILVVRQFKVIYSKQSKYSRELKKILSKYDDCIVRVNRLYVNKKYDMVYIDSFSELMDVHNKKNKMISFKETKRDSEATFVIIDDEIAWIYKLVSDDLD